MRAAVILAAVAVLACAAMPASAYRAYAEGGALQRDDPLSYNELLDIAVRRATCPFVGSMVASGVLPVGQSVTRPLAQVSAVVAIGNTGPRSTLGYVLKLFATGNHARMASATTPNKLTVPTPAGWFSLDLAGSQGSHAGHSGILEGNPTIVAGGRWSAVDWDRLLAKQQGAGLLTTKAFGEYIGENIARDPASKTVTSGGLLSVLFPDSLKLLGSLGNGLWSFLQNPAKADPIRWRNAVTSLTKLLGDDNLIGSAGEFGLLLAFLEQSPNTKKLPSGEIGFSVAEITGMFRDKKLPSGWDKWTKSALSWMKYSSQLTYHARHRLNAIKKF